MRYSPDDFPQASISKLVTKRHPYYLGLLEHWKFLHDCYRGGPEWFKGNVFRYMKEGDKEYGDRVKRAYRFNHTREVVDLVNKYLYRQKPKRNWRDAPTQLVEFWKNSTINGLSMDELAKSISIQASIYGRVYVVVDSTVTEDMLTEEDVERQNGQIYSYIVTPENVLDMSYDNRGVLNWILIRETVRDDESPLLSTGNMVARYRLWTRNQWFVFKARSERIQTEHPDVHAAIASTSQPILRDSTEALELVASGDHNMGIVPVIPADNTITNALYESPSLVGDIAYLDRACANYASNLDAIIQDQTFSQLAMPAQGLMPGDDEYEKLLELGTKRIFIYDGESGAQPFFLSPDPRQAQLISSAINQIIGEIYHSVGLGVERSKDVSTQNADKASGVAKSIDFERVAALLTSKADSMQQIENRISHIACMWAGIDVGFDDFVGYPQSFDVRELYDEFYIATQMALIEMPVSVRGEQMKSVIKKLFPQMSQDLKKKMMHEVDEWVEEGEDLARQEHLNQMMNQVVETTSVETGEGMGAKPSSEPDKAASASGNKDSSSLAGSPESGNQTVVIINELKKSDTSAKGEDTPDYDNDDDDEEKFGEGKYKGMGHDKANGMSGSDHGTQVPNPYSTDPENPSAGSVPEENQPTESVAQTVFKRQKKQTMTRKIGENTNSGSTSAERNANQSASKEESNIAEEAKRNRELSGRIQSISKSKKRNNRKTNEKD